jgi:hypothetical protein
MLHPRITETMLGDIRRVHDQHGPTLKSCYTIETTVVEFLHSGPISSIVVRVSSPQTQRGQRSSLIRGNQERFQEPLFVLHRKVTDWAESPDNHVWTRQRASTESLFKSGSCLECCLIRLSRLVILHFTLTLSLAQDSSNCS